jgi:hypothetical protein
MKFGRKAEFGINNAIFYQFYAVLGPGSDTRITLRNRGLFRSPLPSTILLRAAGSRLMGGPPRTKQNRCRASGGPPLAPGGNFMLYRVFLAVLQWKL